MAYSVNWDTKVITIPQSDLIDLGGGKYKLDLYEFKNKCRALESSLAEGLSYDPIISYNSNVDTGDVILAKVVLLINGYTVTFEDGQYAVLLDGANTNVHNYTNINQVSIRPNNSTGLQDLSTLLAMAYMDRVVIDVVGGQSGVGVPIGTLGRPSNNITDAMSIANKNGISRLYTIRDITLTTGDNISQILLSGIDPSMTTLTIEDAATVTEARFKDLYIIGILDGDSSIDDCITGNISYFSGTISNSAIHGTIQLNGNHARMHGCSMADYDIVPTIDINNGLQDAVITEYTGLLTFTNSTVAGTQVGVGLLGGKITIDASCTEGTFIISGDGTYENNGGPNVVVDTSGLNNPQNIANEVFNTTVTIP